MATKDPNTTLLQAKDQFASDKTPAPLAGSSSYVGFGVRGIPPPAELYVNVDDALVLQAATSLGNEVVTVNVRLLLPTGRLEDMQFVIRPASTRTVLRIAFSLAEGFLLSVSATSAVATTRGQTFARIFLQRGASGAGQPGQVLFSDYLTTFASPAYPAGRTLTPTDGAGLVYIFQVTQPAAGSDWIQLPPSNTRWRVRAAHGLLTTSAAVANRQVRARINGSAVDPWFGPPTQNIAASLAVNVSLGGIAPYTSVTTTDITIPLPPDLIIANSGAGAVGLAVSTLNLQAADQWSNIGILVEEWLDNV